MLLKTPRTIAIAPLRRLDEAIAATGARQVVSVMNAHLMPPTPFGIRSESHLQLAVSDGRIGHGSSEDSLRRAISSLLEFAISWDQESPLVVHCFSGLNRSTAAAYIILAALNPGVPEALIAYRLRATSDTAAPHLAMVGSADKLLSRNGNLTSAIEMIGPGLPAAEGVPFSLHVDFGPG